MRQLASQQAKGAVKQLKLLAQIPFQPSKPVRIGTANLIPIQKAEYLVPKQKNDMAQGGSQQRKGLNYVSNHYVSEGTHAAIQQLLLNDRQSDLYADLFGGGNLDNETISEVREFVHDAHEKLRSILGDSSVLERLDARHKLLEEAVTKARDIRDKLDKVWSRGNKAKTIASKGAAAFMLTDGGKRFEVHLGTRPKAGSDKPLQNAYSLKFDTFAFEKASSAVTAASVSEYAVKKGLDWLQPEYFTGIGNSREDMALLAEKFRTCSEAAKDAIFSSKHAKNALNKAYGEKGCLFIENVMNEVDRAAYYYMQALQQKSAMQPDEHLAETGVTSAALQLLYARLEEARFIDAFGEIGPGKYHHPVVEFLRPGSEFAGAGVLLMAKDPGNINQTESTVNQPEAGPSTRFNDGFSGQTILQHAAQQARYIPLQLELLAQALSQPTKTGRLGIANTVPMLEAGPLVPSKESDGALGDRRQRKGVNYASTHWISKETYAQVQQLLLNGRQSDIYADVFGDVENADNKTIREALDNAHKELCRIVSNNPAYANKLKTRHEQIQLAAIYGKNIRDKMDQVWSWGNSVKSVAVPVAINTLSFLKDAGVVQFRYGDIPASATEVAEKAPDKYVEFDTSLFQNFLSPSQGSSMLSTAAASAVIYAINKAHDWYQPEYFTGLGNSRKDVASLAKDFLNNREALASRTIKDALNEQHGENGRLLLERAMNEVDRAADNYMQALQRKPAKLMQPDAHLAETKVTSAALHLLYARLEEARIINNFKKEKQLVGEPSQPSAAFPHTLIQARKQRGTNVSSSSQARHDEGAEADINSMERWDYSPDLSKTLENLERTVAFSGKDNLNLLKSHLSAAKKGDADKLFDLANLCEVGRLGIPQGVQASRIARQLFTPAAEKGNVEAQYRLGRLLADKRFTGQAGLRNDYAAVEWLTKAAEQGHPKAKAKLGVMHATGRSGLDAKEAAVCARMLCEEAVKAGVHQSDVLYTLARLYHEGQVDASTDEERLAVAAKWYVKAAEEGHTGAQRELGLLHFNRTPGLMGWSRKEANDIDAAHYLQMAAKQNDAQALYFLGEMYLVGRASIEGGTAKEAGIGSIKRAADGGYAPAQFKLGQMLVKGEIGTEDGIPDYQEAARYFAEAAKQGHTEAQCELAELFVKGLAQPENGKLPNAAAIDLYKQAANKGSMAAQLALAKLYKDGRGNVESGPETNRKIAEYLTLAASQEGATPSVAYELAELYARRTPGLESGQEGDKLAVRWYTQAADKEMSDAQYKLANLYLEGRVDGVTNQERVVMAEKWHIKAVKNGHAQAQRVLGLLHLSGTPHLTGTRKTKGANDADAARYLQMAAKQNDLEATYFLGEMYLDGRASIENGTAEEVAVEYYKRAANGGYAKAQFKLGQMLVEGKTGTKDGKPNYQEAARRFSEAAKQGHKEAQYELADLFVKKLAAPEDRKSPHGTVMSLYKQAAQQGLPKAQYKLALMHLESLSRLPVGEKADRKIVDETIQLLTKATEQGHPQACYELGYLHEQPRFGFIKEPDLKKAVELYRVAAQAKVASAQYRLAMLYWNGKVEGVDEQAAWNEVTRLLQQAAEQDHVHASFHYGRMLLDDRSKSSPDAQIEGRALMEKAAEKGDPDLQYQLATTLLDYNFEANNNLMWDGMWWLEKAADQGHSGALGRLEKLCTDNQLSPQQIKRAVGYFQKAADEGKDKDAMRFLGWMHEAGLAAPKPNPFLAFSWYHKAVEHGDDGWYTLFRLGALTETGHNHKIMEFDKDEQAVKYYRQALDKDKDNVQIKSALDRMAKQGRGGLQKDTAPDGEVARRRATAAEKGKQKVENA